MRLTLDTPNITRMDDSKIIDALGGTTAVALLCKVRPPSVSGWRRNGIPPARRQFIELLRPDLFSARALALGEAGDPKARRTPAAPDGGAAAEADADQVQPLSKVA